MNPLLFSRYTATTCLGHGVDPLADGLRAQRHGLTPCDFPLVDLQTWIGRVHGLDEVVLRPDLIGFDCRNHRLSQLGLEQDGFAQAVFEAKERYGARRIGVFIGTSTAGILTTEQAYQRRDPLSGALPADYCYQKTHNPYSVSDFVRRYFALNGPAMTISSACSSSAKVFGSARRMIEAGLIDAAIVGGVDTLCLTTLYGFNALELLSATPCRPFDVDRRGISLGEAAAFALLERVPSKGALSEGAILVTGIGESSDAYHMSSPHPEGLGALAAMQQALVSAHLQPEAIDYINLHGTGTKSNDKAESLALRSLFSGVPCSSTKGAVGHTLGAAGGVEAVISALALQHGMIPAGMHTEIVDPAIDINYVLATVSSEITCVLSNSFGFGGTNCSLVLQKVGRTHD